MNSVTVYSRPGCHLCEQAIEALVALHGEGYRFQLHEVDIEGEELLLRRLLESDRARAFAAIDGMLGEAQRAHETKESGALEFSFGDSSSRGALRAPAAFTASRLFSISWASV